ncbi:MAG: pyridoxal phosphate-dependent aminotransferase [Fidelibacterota bacterium]
MTSQLKFAKRVSRVKPSYTLEMASKAAEMRFQGIDVINFSVGEPDFNTPDHIIEAGKKAMDDGYTKYTAGSGMIELRQAICEKLKRENGLEYIPNEILVSNGEKQSLYNACQVLFDQGDEVVIFTPYWVSFPEFVRLADAEPIIVNTLSQKQFEVDFNDLEKKTTENIKGVIVNSPSNPTGGVWSSEALMRLLNIAANRDWTVISDECYERLIFDGGFISAEKLNRDHNIGARVITCMSLSKTYAMTGWRIGYAAGEQAIIKAMSKVQGQATSCANSIGQRAAIAALTGDQRPVEEMRLKFKKRRDLMVGLLNEIPGVSCAIPGGAFYTFPNMSHYIGKKINGKIIQDSFDLSGYILNSGSVVTVPGDGFGAPGHIRFSCATDRDTIRRGISKVAYALKQLN